MIIKQASIHAFGKFIDQTFDFSNHLHLIQGLNEAGKTTLHAFIEGILYGFLQPSASRRIFYPEHAKYQPSQTDHYGGALIIEHQKKTYRIERNLSKTRFTLKIYIEATGEDITHTLEQDAIARTADIAKWLNIPYIVYRNTLSIRQLRHAPDAALGNELIDRLKNVAHAKSEALAPDKALETLSKRFKAIGSDQSQKTPYAVTLKQRNDLEDERNEALRNREVITDLLAKRNSLNEAIAIKDQEVAKAYQADLNIEKSRKKRAFKEIEGLHIKVENLKKQLEPLRTYQTFNKEDNQKHTQAMTEHASIRKQLDQKEGQLAPLNATLEQISTDPLITPETLKTLRNDRETLLKNDYELKRLRERKGSSTLQASKQVIEDEIRVHRAKLIRMLKLSFLLIPLIVVVVLWFKGKKLQNERTRIEKTLAVSTEQNQETKRTIATLEEVTANLLKKHQVEDFTAFETYYQATEKTYDDDQVFREQRKDAKRLQNETVVLKASLDKSAQALKDIYQKYDVDSPQAFQAFYEKHENYQTLEQETSYYQTALQEKLGNQTLEALKKTIDFDVDDLDETTIASIRTTYETLKDQRDTMILDRERLIESIKHQASLTRDVDVIHYQLIQTEKALEDLTTERETIANAIKRIEEAVAHIQEHFAPLLSTAIAKHLRQLTLNRYETIKIRKNMDFAIHAQATGRLEDINYFSTGTLDQIYLSIRLGILEALGYDKAPLFLDDVFAATDDERLKSALKLLTIQAKTRQILLMTCHQREKELLDKEEGTTEITRLI